MDKARRRFLGVALGTGVLMGTAPAHAQLFDAPRPDLWPRWQAYDPGSTATIDHGAWQAILTGFVRLGGDGITRVDYAGLLASRSGLDGYLDAMSTVPISQFIRDEQFAYWVNLYNAVTVRVILDHWPVASIRDIDISPGLFANGPWGAELIMVEGISLTLDDIEHRILRPIWGDPRIHYAVNCAAIGCPNLQTQAFTAANTDAVLEAAAAAFVNHPRGARVGRDGLVVSSIYSWFDEDFGSSDAGVIAHLRQYAGPALSSALSGVTDIDDHAYDWALNGL